MGRATMAARGAGHLLLLCLSFGLIAADSHGEAPPTAAGHPGEVSLLHQVGHSGHGLAQGLLQVFVGIALTGFYAVVLGVLGLLWFFGVNTVPFLQPALGLAGVKALAFFTWII